MESFAVHSRESAPEGSRELLTAVGDDLGFVPNLMGAPAEATAEVAAYLTLSRLFESSSLTAVERHVVLLSVSFENGCAPAGAAIADTDNARGTTAESTAGATGSRDDP